jgi:hypothetical protein
MPRQNWSDDWVYIILNTSTYHRSWVPWEHSRWLSHLWWSRQKAMYLLYHVSLAHTWWSKRNHAKLGSLLSCRRADNCIYKHLFVFTSLFKHFMETTLLARDQITEHRKTKPTKPNLVSIIFKHLVLTSKKTAFRHYKDGLVNAF